MSQTEKQESKKVEINFLRCYKELFNPYWRYFLFYGGRNSGKSYHSALALLLLGRRKKLRILCTREIQKTIKDSVHKLLSDLIYKYEFGEYVITNDSIFNKAIGTEFIFKGLRQNITEIKSTEGIDICWVEEAQSISDTSLDTLIPTIRKDGSQIIFTFNRFNELDPVFVRFVLNQTPKAYIKKVNYDVLEKAGLLTQTIKEEVEKDKANPNLFAHVWLGEPLAQGENSIIARTEILEAMNRTVTDEGQYFIGVDVARMGDDRTVFWKRKGLKTVDTREYSKLRTTEVCDKLEQFCDFNKDIDIKIDDTGVGGGVTDEMMKRGYSVVPINFGGEPADKDKYPNLISEAWFYVKSIMSEIELPMDNDLLMELSTRQWKQDIRGRRVVEGKDVYKKRGFRSPDKADACIICYYNKDTIMPDIQYI